jgi:hypothetical protein
VAEFDPKIIHQFQAEGFNVIYLPFLGCGDSEKDRKSLENAVHLKEDELETGERYAIVGMLFIFFSCNCFQIPEPVVSIHISILTLCFSISPSGLPSPGLAPFNAQQHKSLSTPLCLNNLLSSPLNGPI